MSDIKRVLLIDDDIVFLRSLARSLTDLGFDIETCTCSAMARTLVQQNQFDCILCDHSMPGQSGLEFLQEVRESHPEVDCFLFSGFVTGLKVAENWAEEIGVKKVLTKPLEAEALALELA